MAKKKAGRPPSGKPVVTNDGRVTPRIALPLSAEFKERLAVIAGSNRRPVSVEAQIAIERYVEQEEAKVKRGG